MGAEVNERRTPDEQDLLPGPGVAASVSTNSRIRFAAARWSCDNTAHRFSAMAWIAPSGPLILRWLSRHSPFRSVPIRFECSEPDDRVR